MADANIKVKNVAGVTIHVEVRDVNDPSTPRFDGDLAPQKESGSIELKPDPVNLDYRICWKATAKGYPDGQEQPFVEDGQIVEVKVEASASAAAEADAKPKAASRL